MRLNLTQEELLPRLQVLVYSLAALSLMVMLYDQYRHGLYPLVLASAIAIPAFLFSAIFVFINRDRRTYRYVNYILVLVLFLLAVYQLPDYPVQMQHYLYAMPLFCFFALPLWQATVVNIILAIIFFSMVWLQQGFIYALRLGTNYSLLLGSVWCFSYLTLLKGWSLRRLTLADPHSGAYKRSHFYHALDREMARSHSHRQSVSLIGIEIDDYPQFFNIHGGRVMAQFLPVFVGEIQQLIRPSDEVFRLNDNFFILLLPNCKEEGAIMLMERIKNALIQHDWTPIHDISLSAGAMEVHLAEDSKDAEKRLQARLNKQKFATLQITAFE